MAESTDVAMKNKLFKNTFADYVVPSTPPRMEEQVLPVIREVTEKKGFDLPVFTSQHVRAKPSKEKSIFKKLTISSPEEPVLPVIEEATEVKKGFDLPVFTSQHVRAKPSKEKSIFKKLTISSPEEPVLPVIEEATEVKKVEWGLLESPWREVDFSVENREALVDSVTYYKPSCDSVSEARVLLLGPVGAGKSSFISSVHSVFTGRVTNRAMVGTSSTSFTQKFQSFPIRRRGESGDQPTALVLCDAMGLGMGEMTGLTLHDVLAVIKGHAPEGHKFSSDQVLRAETVGYVKKPSAREKMHCVAFVVDATKIDSYGKGMGFTFQQLREHISDLGVHQVALLTHVDQICPETARDITKVYRSRLVQHTMKKAAALLGMSMSYIVPVKNYSCELDVDEHTNTLLLCAVQHILQYVELYSQDLTELRVV